ncbi:MAG: helix-turn-helix transcriptional regulator [Lentisphaerae bacterium]|nr:helix-turn-helix transcriptional regulator [Lentisphaerota bacterium]
MGYFDDLQLLNVIHVEMYGSAAVSEFVTSCNYVGVMTGSVIVNDVEVTEPFVYLTPRNLRAYDGWLSPQGKKRDNFYIECLGGRSDRLMHSWGATGRWCHIPIGNPERFTGKLEEIRRLFIAGNPRYNFRMAMCFEEFAAMLEEEAVSKEPAARKFDKLLQKINRDPGRHWNFAAEAAASGLTLRHWTRLFTAGTGMPPHQFVIHCRVRLARELLANSSLNIKEIGAACGFDSPAEFSRFFRKHTSFSPGRYRKSRLI